MVAAPGTITPTAADQPFGDLSSIVDLIKNITGTHSTSQENNQTGLGDQANALLQTVLGQILPELQSDQYSPEAATRDSQALVQQIMTQYRESTLPQIYQQEQNTGGYNSTTAQLMANDAMARAAAQGAAEVTKTKESYANVRNQQMQQLMTALVALMKSNTTSNTNKNTNNNALTNNGNKGLGAAAAAGLAKKLLNGGGNGKPGQQPGGGMGGRNNNGAANNDGNGKDGDGYPADGTVGSKDDPNYNNENEDPYGQYQYANEDPTQGASDRGNSAQDVVDNLVPDPNAPDLSGDLFSGDPNGEPSSSDNLFNNIDLGDMGLGDLPDNSGGDTSNNDGTDNSGDGSGDSTDNLDNTNDGEGDLIYSDGGDFSFTDGGWE